MLTKYKSSECFPFYIPPSLTVANIFDLCKLDNTLISYFYFLFYIRFNKINAV